MNKSDKAAPSQPSTSSARKEGAVRTIAIQDLLQGEKSVKIKLEDKIYTLQITSNGKLILTK